ncbi:MAG: hypothetical protein IJS65_04520 [Clostridia bacterium]|nr:hypothetical protein [Clostridia bacterium]
MNIYATLGPSCSRSDVIYKMIVNGMTGARINASHGNIDSASEYIKELECAEKAAGVKTERLIDLRGAEIRIGTFGKTLELKPGDRIVFGRDIVLHPDVTNKLKRGMTCRFNDGMTEGVTDNDGGCIITKGGELIQGKSFAVPGVTLCESVITESDNELLLNASEFKIDSVMLPFARCENDVLRLRKILCVMSLKEIKIYAKIEDGEGLKNAESIIKASDKTVIARGDLGNNTDIYSLPREQKKLAALCNKYGKPFIVATGLLTSMEITPSPSRAEVNDIYNCALDGANGLMLTGETAIGKYPAEAVKALSDAISALA